MSQSAANAVDYVFPNQAARQWVISLPFDLRYWVAADANLMDKILAIVNSEISKLYRTKAQEEHGVISGQTGSISYVQRAGGQINVNPHIHLLQLEGVFDEGVKRIRNPKFYTTSKPTDDEVLDVSDRIAKRVIKMLQKRGLLKVEDDFCETEQPKLDGIDLIRDASIKGYVAIGERAGQKIRRIRSLGVIGEKAKLKSSRCVSVNGFSIHADSMVKKNRPQELERILRYMARPPLSLDRLSYDDDGDIILTLRHQFSDGTHSLLFSPIEILEKIASIIPLPPVEI